MKSLIALVALALSSQAFSEEVSCRAEKAIQPGFANMKADAQLDFALDRKTKTISKLVGHIFVQTPYAETNEEISTENSYMGFFKFDSIASNPNYRPNVYKGFTQFKEFDATHTAGQEDGMWGSFVVDLNTADKFEAKYVFQAGDHMGGTVLLNCRSKK